METAPETLCADISSAEGPGETFDVVVSQEVIEHVEDQRGYLRWIGRCLAPGGFLILTTPNARNLERWSREEIEAWGPQPIEKRLTPGQLRDLLRPAFRIVSMRTFIQGYGSRGLFRIVRSPRLGGLVRALRISGLFEWVLDRAGFGLHIVVVAKLPPERAE